MALSEKSRMMRARAAAQRASELSKVTGVPVSERTRRLASGGVIKPTPSQGKATNKPTSASKFR